MHGFLSGCGAERSAPIGARSFDVGRGHRFLARDCVDRHRDGERDQTDHHDAECCSNGHGRGERTDRRRRSGEGSNQASAICPATDQRTSARRRPKPVPSTNPATHAW